MGKGIKTKRERRKEDEKKGGKDEKRRKDRKEGGNLKGRNGNKRLVQGNVILMQWLRSLKELMQILLVFSTARFVSVNRACNTNHDFNFRWARAAPPRARS